MFVDFLHELRKNKVPVGMQEAVSLARALSLGLHDSSLEGFYLLARSILVHRETHLDAFDVAFAEHFEGSTRTPRPSPTSFWPGSKILPTARPSPRKNERCSKRSTWKSFDAASTSACASRRNDTTAATVGSGPGEPPRSAVEA